MPAAPTFRVTALYEDESVRTYDFSLKFEAFDKLTTLARDRKVVETEGPVEGTIQRGQFVRTLSADELAAEEARKVAGVVGLLLDLDEALVLPGRVNPPAEVREAARARINARKPFARI